VVAQGSAPVDCYITLSGNFCYIGGIYPLKVVKKATSHYIEGFMFAPAFKQRRWDGRRHFFIDKSSSFPIGLLDMVLEALKKANPKGRVVVQDERVRPPHGEHGFDLIGIEFGKGKYDYQMGGAEALVKHGRGILKIATNGGKTEVAAAVTKHLALPTLFLVERIQLVTQTRKRFAERLGIDITDIGMIGDSKCTVGKWITVATPTSLKNRLAEPDVQEGLARWQLVWSDECHHTSSDTHYEILTKVQAYFRFAMSGTPLDRDDGSDMRLIAMTGPIRYEVSNRLLVERGISVEPKLEMIRIKEPKLADQLTWATVNKLGVTENEQLNNTVANRAVAHANDGKQVVVMVEKIKHGKAIQKLIKEHRCNFKMAYITGSDDLDKREAVLEDFVAGRIKCIIATTILDEGIDIPNIEVLILAAGGKSKIRLLQRVGRGLRTGENKDHLHVIDFAIFSHRWLLKHSMQRLKAYKVEDCFKISAP